MAVLQEFKCPCCDGAIGFDSASQKMKCPYCDTEFEVDAIKSYMEDTGNPQQDDMSWEKMKRRVFPRVLNYVRNKEFLENVPYMKYMDFAVCFFYNIKHFFF